MKKHTFDNFKDIVSYVNRDVNRDDTKYQSSIDKWFDNTNKVGNKTNIPKRKSIDNKRIDPSEEQLELSNRIENGDNLIVDSVFGSGKTTSILEICRTNQSKRILILTFNAKLKIETKQRCEKLGLKNVEVHSYHALAVKAYHSKGNTDSGIQYIIENNLSIRRIRPPNLIIMDEHQDMTPLYYRLIIKFIKDLSLNNIQFALLGDKYQNIYSYKGSDSRFLTLGDKLFQSDRQWSRKILSHSYRTTDPIRYFINKYLLGNARIASNKKGEPIRYLLTDSFGMTPFDEVKAYLSAGYSVDDIYILAPSLRTQKSPVRILENRLSSEGIPCFVPVSDSDELNNDLISGKIVFSTFHQIKGSERPVVIIFNFDESYFTYYAKNESKYICPNPVYVAISRSLERLTLIHHYENETFGLLNSLNTKRIDIATISNDPNISFIQNKRQYIDRTNKSIGGLKDIDTPITDLLRHLDYNIVEKCLEYLEIQTFQSSGKIIQIPLTIKTNHERHENVSEINGIAIPMLYEILNKKSHCSALNYIITKMDKLPVKHRNKILGIRSQIVTSNNITISDALYIANIYNSLVSGYISKREQITEYDWITKKQVEKTLSRLKRHIKSNAIFEMELTNRQLGRLLIGQIDVIQSNGLSTEIWELKCVKQISQIHILQLAIYGFLYKKNRSLFPKMLLFNCLNDEIVEIIPKKNLDEMVDLIIKERYNSEKYQLSDTEFIRKMLNRSISSVKKNPKSIFKTELDQKSVLLIDSDSD